AQFLAGDQGRDEVQIDRVPADHLGFFQGGPGGGGHPIGAAGANADHIYFFHSVQFQSGPKALAARASVTPPPACLPTSSVPPSVPQTAARSHTLSTPTVCATKAEGANRPGACSS